MHGSSNRQMNLLMVPPWVPRTREGGLLPMLFVPAKLPFALPASDRQKTSGSPASLLWETAIWGRALWQSRPFGPGRVNGRNLDFKPWKPAEPSPSARERGLERLGRRRPGPVRRWPRRQGSWRRQGPPGGDRPSRRRPRRRPRPREGKRSRPIFGVRPATPNIGVHRPPRPRGDRARAGWGAGLRRMGLGRGTDRAEC